MMLWLVHKLFNDFLHYPATLLAHWGGGSQSCLH